MTETAEMADIILPASFPFETGGSFTNTQKQIQNFEKLLHSKLKMSNIEQLASLCKQFELEQTDDIHEIQDEYMAMIAEAQKYKLVLRYTAEELPQKYFKSGCDALHAKAEKLFS